MQRLLSGSRRLDALLGEGLPADAVNLVVGLPGAGKTMLVQQYVFANATRERPAIYMTTASEPFDKLLRYGQELDFFDPQAVGVSVFYEDLGRGLNRGGLPAVLERIDALTKERRPGIVVIDSFRALRAYADPEEFRRFLHDLAGRASAFPASHFWVGEYTASDMAWAPEFAVADAILSLSSELSGERSARALEILKLRGSGFRSGRHAYRLGAGGLDVFPRLADLDRAETAAMPASTERVSSGVGALDALLSGGFRDGSTTLIGGPTGSGKTLMGLHFIFSGADQGTPGVIASLQESEAELDRVAEGFGWSTTHPQVHVQYSSPVDLYVDEWVYGLLDLAERTGSRRILLDSLTDLGAAVPDAPRFREYMYSLAQRCKKRGISLMVTLELPDLYDHRDTGQEGVSHLADNVVLLQYIRRAQGMRRAMTVLKARATRLDPQALEYSIGEHGIELGAELHLGVTG